LIVHLRHLMVNKHIGWSWTHFPENKLHANSNDYHLRWQVY
jgi:hypothetical protein